MKNSRKYCEKCSANFEAKHREEKAFCNQNASKMRGLTRLFDYSLVCLVGSSCCGCCRRCCCCRCRYHRQHHHDNDDHHHSHHRSHHHHHHHCARWPRHPRPHCSRHPHYPCCPPHLMFVGLFVVLFHDDLLLFRFDCQLLFVAKAVAARGFGFNVEASASCLASVASAVNFTRCCLCCWLSDVDAVVRFSIDEPFVFFIQFCGVQLRYALMCAQLW